jgi:hypothetical protein
LKNISAVNQQSKHFFQLYRHREGHSKLNGQSPEFIHHQISPKKLDDDFVYIPPKIPLQKGRIHFMRQVDAGGTVRVLNANWNVPDVDETQGVWVTISFRSKKCTLSIFDAVPNAKNRCLLISHPFPLTESVESSIPPVISKSNLERPTVQEEVYTQLKIFDF